jgi:hypothetical protein
LTCALIASAISTVATRQLLDRVGKRVNSRYEEPLGQMGH